MPAATTTIGVVILVPEPHATVLRNWRRRVGDPQADVIWPHVTLLPPTEVARDDLDKIEAHLHDAAQASGPFAMHLSGTGTFRPVSPVVFVQVARGVGDCEVLEKAIRAGVLHRELDYPYHPHITVAQDVADEQLDEVYDALAEFVARFVADRFELAERDDAGNWVPRADFVLGSGRV